MNEGKLRPVPPRLLKTAKGKFRVVFPFSPLGAPTIQGKAHKPAGVHYSGTGDPPPARDRLSAARYGLAAFVDRYTANPCGDTTGGFQKGNTCQKGGQAVAEAPKGKRPFRPEAKQAKQAAPGSPAKAPRINPPSSHEDIPRFINDAKNTEDFKAVESRLASLASEVPDGDVRKWSIHKNQVDGKWTPERKALHDKIVNAAVNPKAKAPEGTRPTIVFLMGPPGSGKTTGGQPQAARLKREFTTINADDIKAQLPEYQGWNAAAVHEESSELAEGVILGKALSENHNILMDLTGANLEKMKELLESVSQNGYDVHLINIALPSWKATGRSWERFTKNAFSRNDPNGEPGRFVPPDYSYYGVDEKPEKTYRTLKEHPGVTGYVSVSTDVPLGEKPTVLEEGGKW